MYLLTSQGAQNYEAHNVFSELSFRGSDFRARENLIFPALRVQSDPIGMKGDS